MIVKQTSSLLNTKVREYVSIFICCLELLIAECLFWVCIFLFALLSVTSIPCVTYSHFRTRFQDFFFRHSKMSQKGLHQIIYVWTFSALIKYLSCNNKKSRTLYRIENGKKKKNCEYFSWSWVSPFHKRSQFYIFTQLHTIVFFFLYVYTYIIHILVCIYFPHTYIILFMKSFSSLVSWVYVVIFQ